jgi:hypothetical protein
VDNLEIGMAECDLIRLCLVVCQPTYAKEDRCIVGSTCQVLQKERIFQRRLHADREMARMSCGRCLPRTVQPFVPDEGSASPRGHVGPFSPPLHELARAGLLLCPEAAPVLSCSTPRSRRQPRASMPRRSRAAPPSMCVGPSCSASRSRHPDSLVPTASSSDAAPVPSYSAPMRAGSSCSVGRARPRPPPRVGGPAPPPPPVELIPAAPHRRSSSARRRLGSSSLFPVTHRTVGPPSRMRR